MMREILFRAKAINRNPKYEYRTSYKNGDWVYGLVSKLYDEDFYEEFPHIPAEMTNEDGVSGIDIDYKTIGQYTGLTDKNGNKIFEGDILKNTLSNSTCIVKWSKTHNAFTLEIQGDIYGFTSIGNKVYEVIGNIYDSPELRSKNGR